MPFSCHLGIRYNINCSLHTTTLLYLFDHDILSQEERVIVDQVQINYYGTLNGTIVPHQSGVTKLLIMRDPHYGRMRFKSVKTLGVLHS